MLPNSVTIQFENKTYSHPILYGEYFNQTLYLLHPDKKIALNISTDKYDDFIKNLFQNIQNKFPQTIPSFQINSFEFLAKSQEFKLKKRKKLLPDSIIFIPTQENSNPIIDIDEFVTMTPSNNPIYFDYPKPDKSKFINQINQLQKKLTKEKFEINFKYIHHSKESDQKIISALNLTDTLTITTPDFTITSSTQPQNNQSINQNILFTENHFRNFQKGQLKLHTKNKISDYTLDQSTSMIQTNVQKNLTLKINSKTKAFDLFKKLSSAINSVSND